MTLSRHNAGRVPAFTLMEVLFAVAASAMVLLAVHMVFYGALRLRNKTAQSLDEAVPLQRALAIIKGDLVNLVPPGGTGTLSGTLQTPLTSGGSTSGGQSSGIGTDSSQGGGILPGTQVGPSLYTATGVLGYSNGVFDANMPWAEIQKVTYSLADPTNNVRGKELFRSVTRNLLPVLQEESDDQWLLSGVEDVAFLFYDGTDWVDTWDSTTSETNLPLAIKVQIELTAAETENQRRTPIELVVPVAVQSRITTTSQDTGGGF